MLQRCGGHCWPCCYVRQAKSAVFTCGLKGRVTTTRPTSRAQAKTRVFQEEFGNGSPTELTIRGSWRCRFLHIPPAQPPPSTCMLARNRDSRPSPSALMAGRDNTATARAPWIKLFKSLSRTLFTRLGYSEGRLCSRTPLQGAPIPPQPVTLKLFPLFLSNRRSAF